MHWPKVAAPLTVLAVLTAACGPADSGDPTPRVSPAGGPALHRVWQISTKTVNPAGALAVGDVVLARDARDDDETVFIDGTTGRIRGRAATGDFGNLLGPSPYATTDARGRPLVVIDQRPTPPAKQSVYDPAGHLVWKSPAKGPIYAGGYVAEPRKVGGKYVLMIHPPSGRIVARLPMPGYRLDDGFDFRVVRPGLLAVTGCLDSDTDVAEFALIDVSRPGRARVSVPRLPHAPTHNAWETVKGDGLRFVQISAIGGHLYAIWTLVLGGEMIARYDAPGTRPVWHRTVPSDPGDDGGIAAYPGPHADTVMIPNRGKPTDSDGFRFLDPATGALIGPAAPGHFAAASGGLVYFLRGHDRDVVTDVIDPRKGRVHTINAATTGVTSSGDLINGAEFNSVRPEVPNLSALDAYRWK